MMKTINECRICKSENLETVIDLGKQALSGVFPNNYATDVEKFLLLLVKCNNCGLVQLKHSVAPELLYHDNYGYRSGINATMSNHLALIVKEIEKKLILNDGDYVIDIASNDGTLLNAYENKNLIRIGIDPSSKQFSQYYEDDIIKIPEFFSYDIVKDILKKNKAKVVTSIAVLYDLEDPHKFVQSVKKILHKDGIWILEQSDLGSMIEANSFDTICHEHLEYYSITVLKNLLEQHKLKIFNVELNSSNGGSHRLYVCNKGSTIGTESKKLISLLEKEKKMCLSETSTFNKFMQSCNMEITRLKTFVKKEQLKGKKFHVYGASTKGNVLLQYSELDAEKIEMAADRNPRKTGCFTPGTKIPIHIEETSRKAEPDYYIVLPWHFRNEFIKRETEYLKNGGSLIFPLPTFEVFTYENL